MTNGRYEGLSSEEREELVVAYLAEWHAGEIDDFELRRRLAGLNFNATEIQAVIDEGGE